MPGIFNDTRGTIWQTCRNIFRQPVGKTSILFSVPEPHRNAYFLQRKSPRLGIDLGIEHHSMCRTAPRPALTLKTGIEGGRISQSLGVAGLQHAQKLSGDVNG